MTITVKYGVDAANKSFPSAPTIGQVISSPSLRAELGYGDNVHALINGVEQPNNATVSDGAIVVIETRANQKAIRK